MSDGKIVWIVTINFELNSVITSSSSIIHTIVVTVTVCADIETFITVIVTDVDTNVVAVAHAIVSSVVTGTNEVCLCGISVWEEGFY